MADPPGSLRRTASRPGTGCWRCASDVSAAAAPLDDMRRARVLARLAARPGRPAPLTAARAGAPGGRRRAARARALALARLMAARRPAALLACGCRCGPPASRGPDRGASSRGGAARGPPAATAGGAAAVSAVRRTRGSPPSQRRRAGRSPAAAGGHRLRLHLGSRATATLIGPARLRVVRQRRRRPAGGEPRPGHAGGGLRPPGRRPAAGPFAGRGHPGRRHPVLGEGRRHRQPHRRGPRPGRWSPARRGRSGRWRRATRSAPTPPAPQRWTREDRRPLEEHARAAAEGVAPVSQRRHATAQRSIAGIIAVRFRGNAGGARRIAAAGPGRPAAGAPARPGRAGAAHRPAGARGLAGARCPRPPSRRPPRRPRPRPCTSAPSRPCAAATGPPRAGSWPRSSRSRTGHPLEDVARYELAQLALRAGEIRARRWRCWRSCCAAIASPPCAQPARLLRCELHLQAGEQPAGPTLPGALPRRLPLFAARRGGAGPAGRDASSRTRPAPAWRRLADEYLQRYPDGRRAEDARRHQARCSQ